MRVHPEIAVGEGAGDLQRVQRVAARFGLDPHHDEAREGPPESKLEEPVERCQRHRADPDAIQAIARDGGGQVERPAFVRAGANGHEQPERPVDEPPDGVRQDRGRALVEPLRIVHREEDRGRLGQQPQEARDRDRQRPLVGQRPGGLDPEERDLERMPLRVGQPSEQARVDIGEEVGQRPERETLLRASGPARQDREAGVRGGAETRRPDGGLADAGIAFEDEHREPARGARDEPLDGRKLVSPADDLVRHGRPRLPLRREPVDLPVCPADRRLRAAERTVHPDAPAGADGADAMSRPSTRPTSSCADMRVTSGQPCTHPASAPQPPTTGPSVPGNRVGTMAGNPLVAAGTAWSPSVSRGPDRSMDGVITFARTAPAR